MARNLRANKMLRPLILGFCAVAVLFAPTYFVGSRKTTMKPFSALIYTIIGFGKEYFSRRGIY